MVKMLRSRSKTADSSLKRSMPALRPTPLAQVQKDAHLNTQVWSLRQLMPPKCQSRSHLMTSRACWGPKKTLSGSSSTPSRPFCLTPDLLPLTSCVASWVEKRSCSRLITSALWTCLRLKLFQSETYYRKWWATTSSLRGIYLITKSAQYKTEAKADRSLTLTGDTTTPRRISCLETSSLLS